MGPIVTALAVMATCLTIGQNTRIRIDSRPISDAAALALPMLAGISAISGSGVPAAGFTPIALWICFEPIVMPIDPPAAERADSKPIVDRPTPITSASTGQPSSSPGDPAQLGRLAVRAGSTQSAKPVSTTGRSPTPSSQNSATSQPGDMPLSAMFSMAASRQSMTSQTPQALKLGWLIAGLALAALLLLLTILVLVERNRDRDAGPPLLPPSASMQ